MSDTRTFTIDEYEVKRTKGDDPKTYGRVKMSPGGWASVWGDSDRKFAEEHLGETVQAAVKEDGNFKNASDFVTVQGVSSSFDDRMSKAEWDEKEDRERLGIAEAVHIQRMIAWKVACPNAPDALLWETYADIVTAARKRAVTDLDWIRNYATGDVPI